MRHPVPRPNFEGCLFLKKSKEQYITSAALEYNFDYESLSLVLNILRHYGHPKVYISHIYSIWQININKCQIRKKINLSPSRKRGGASIRKSASIRINTVFMDWIKRTLGPFFFCYVAQNHWVKKYVHHSLLHP